MFYLYILKNRRNGEIYLGYTGDPKRRFDEHGSDIWEPIYFEGYKSEEDARDRERKLKYYGKSLAMLKKRIARSLHEG